MVDLKLLGVAELLLLHASVLDELRARGVVRSSNGPAGDYAELLFSRAFGWNLVNNSSAGFDATDAGGTRYQIKCRRLTAHNGSRQLSAIRRLTSRPFDVLAAVLLDEQFRVTRGALIPVDVVTKEARFTEHTNSSRFMLRDTVWRLDGVQDVTAKLKAAEGEM